MMSKTTTAKIVATALAVGVHGIALAQYADQPPTQIAGGAKTAQAAIGTSFKDMSAGTISAVQTDAVLSPTPPDVIQASEPPKTLTAVTPTPTQTLQPVKPATVTPPKAEKPKPTKKPKKKPAKKPTPKGNAAQNNKQGATTGTKNAKAKKQGTNKSAAKQSGNAAKSNYPGKVMRKIAKVRRPRSAKRGSVTITFSIAASGGLSAVSVAKSSGQAKLDQLALQVIKKAAPFPKPPTGAQRRFTITIKSR